MAEPIKYLDYNGLSHFWTKIKSYVDNNSGGVSEIAWDNSSNMNNYKTKGIYFISGVHSNSGDNMPTTAYANGNIGAFLIITESTLDTTLQEKIIGQKLVLSNKVSSESKEYIRSCKIKNGQETWSPWKETNNILLFGDKSSGVASHSDIDNAIDNGQYMGIYITQDGFIPAGSTFTMTVINNYAANSSLGKPNNRQVTQVFIYTPLSTNGEINESVMCKRDGIGSDSITWGDMMPIGVGKKTAEGGEIFNNISGDYANTAAFKAHAEGGGVHMSVFYTNKATGEFSHAEGINTTATHVGAHAEGRGTTATGEGAHAEGYETIASGEASHAEGINTTASGYYSHAEGYNTSASGYYSHVEGYGTQAYQNSEHAEGVYNKSYDSTDDDKRVIHSVGIGVYGNRKNAHEIKFNGDHYIFGLGGYDGTNSDTANTLQEVINEKPGKKVSTSSNSGEIFNDYTNNVASGQYSHAEGRDTNALGNYGAHAEGYQTQAGDSSNDYSPHAEGYQTKATGDYGAHSEGKGTTASGSSSHAEGGHTTASGYYSHAEGSSTTASGYYSHAEGSGTTAEGQASHAEGSSTTAEGQASHAEGYYTQTYQQGEHAEGSYNKSYNSTSTDIRVIHSVGIGSSTSNRKNAHEIKYNGDHYVYGIGGYDGTNYSSAKTLQDVVNGGNIISIPCSSDTSNVFFNSLNNTHASYDEIYITPPTNSSHKGGAWFDFYIHESYITQMFTRMSSLGINFKTVNIHVYTGRTNSRSSGIYLPKSTGGFYTFTESNDYTYKTTMSNGTIVISNAVAGGDGQKLFPISSMFDMTISFFNVNGTKYVNIKYIDTLSYKRHTVQIGSAFYSTINIGGDFE